jgi:anhydro-N-acetylmuramic acid kinase
VLTQFRNTDSALGGQGAPLVPIGDKLLFDSVDFRLNLGGIANISFAEHEKTTAFDICVCNMALNYLSSISGFSYDENGRFAKAGQLNFELLSQLSHLDFFKKQPPKSLGFEWFEDIMQPILTTSECLIEDKLHTVCEHIALQISNIVNNQPAISSKKMLVTGGGAKNDFLMSRIKYHCSCQIDESNPLIVDFKEALIFAFLGVLRLREESNCLSDVTGAKHDNIGGCVYLGNEKSL